MSHALLWSTPGVGPTSLPPPPPGPGGDLWRPPRVGLAVVYEGDRGQSEDGTSDHATERVAMSPVASSGPAAQADVGEVLSGGRVGSTVVHRCDQDGGIFHPSCLA